MQFYLNQKGGGGGATHHDEVNIYFRQLEQPKMAPDDFNGSMNSEVTNKICGAAFLNVNNEY